jgi:hypothetical protein
LHSAENDAGKEQKRKKEWMRKKGEGNGNGNSNWSLDMDWKRKKKKTQRSFYSMVAQMRKRSGRSARQHTPAILKRREDLNTLLERTKRNTRN